MSYPLKIHPYPSYCSQAPLAKGPNGESMIKVGTMLTPQLEADAHWRELWKIVNKPGPDEEELILCGNCDSKPCLLEKRCWDCDRKPCLYFWKFYQVKRIHEFGVEMKALGAENKCIRAFMQDGFQALMEMTLKEEEVERLPNCIVERLQLDWPLDHTGHTDEEIGYLARWKSQGLPVPENYLNVHLDKMAAEGQKPRKLYNYLGDNPLLKYTDDFRCCVPQKEKKPPHGIQAVNLQNEFSRKRKHLD